jgi:hypothetical protein
MANYPTPNIILSLQSGSDLSDAQYKAIVLSSDGKCDLASSNAQAIGFLMNAANSAVGSYLEIASVGGGAKATAGGTISAGDELCVDANGDLIKAYSGNNVIAVALESAVDNDIFGVLVTPKVSSGTTQLFTATGTVQPGVDGIELAHNSTVIAATIANATNHIGLFTVKNKSASGTAAHTVTLTAGTWNGTNTVVTLNAPNEFITVLFDSSGNGSIVENVGSVALS